MKSSITLTLVALLSSYYVSALPFADESVCPGGEVEILSETYIGKDHNVKMTTLSCSTKVHASNTLSARQTTPVDVCDANCNTNCFIPAGGGPDPNECHVIADAILFDSQNVGALFTIPVGNSTSNPVVMQFRSCKTFFVNQSNQALEYCRTDWSTLVDFLAFNCQATQNAHGGNCVAVDGRWFVQVQTS